MKFYISVYKTDFINFKMYTFRSWNFIVIHIHVLSLLTSTSQAYHRWFVGGQFQELGDHRVYMFDQEVGGISDHCTQRVHSGLL